ncbi:MAG: hypothetical protein QOF70_3391, partial [Acetobacteraceae bacterium]|nr:hypothetical protein [Acetobacteraceae bacterium]
RTTFTSVTKLTGLTPPFSAKIGQKTTKSGSDGAAEIALLRWRAGAPDDYS